MKLATYRDGSRDGQLVVVSRDLRSAHYASGAATRLQQALDDWNFHAPLLEELSQVLNHGKARHAFAFEPARCMAPLPRAAQWAVGSAFVSQAERLKPARGAERPPGAASDPPMRQGDASGLLGPGDDIVCASEDHGIDCEAGVAVVTGDIAMGTGADAALEGIRLVMLANEVRLRERIRADFGDGCCGGAQSTAATAFSPVALTPDELGPAWRGGRLALALESTWNGERIGLCDAGTDMTFHFGQLIAQLCTTRNVRAGSVVGSGAVSNRDASNGFSCIAERRAVETVEHGAPTTPFMHFGDRIRIEITGADGAGLFGAIDQRVARAGAYTT